MRLNLRGAQRIVVDRHFIDRDALAGGFGGYVEREVDGELARRRRVEEWAGDGFAVEGFGGGCGKEPASSAGGDCKYGSARGRG